MLTEHERGGNHDSRRTRQENAGAIPSHKDQIEQAGHPELSSVFINFFPKAMRPKTSLPSERSDNKLEPGNEQPQTDKPKEDGL